MLEFSSSLILMPTNVGKYMISTVSSRCFESGVAYLDSKVEKIIEAKDGHSLVACEREITIPCRCNRDH